MAQKRKPPEFSKVIVIIIALVCAIVIAFTFTMIWRTEDLSPLTYLIPAVFGLAATAVGFYFAKAKVENRIKLMKKYKVEPTPESFNDSGESGSDYYDIGGYG